MRCSQDLQQMLRWLRLSVQQLTALSTNIDQMQSEAVRRGAWIPVAYRMRDGYRALAARGHRSEAHWQHGWRLLSRLGIRPGYIDQDPPPGTTMLLTARAMAVLGRGITQQCPMQTVTAITGVGPSTND